MRFISVFATFIAALLSVVLIFGCYKEKTAIENAGGFEDVLQKTENYRQDIASLEAELEEIARQKAQAQERLDKLQSLENYKTEPTAFLTFDSGFSQYSVETVKILDQNQIKGTFFVVAENLKANETLRKALKEAFDNDHKIGIRSYSDNLSKIYRSEEAYFEDLYACRDLVKEITGEAPVLVRMPGGSATAEYWFKKYTGSNEVFQKVLSRLIAEGFVVNDWSVDTKNAQQSDVDQIVSTTLNGSGKVLKATQKTCVVLFVDNKRVPTSLPRIISGLKEQGYQFAGLPTGVVITRQRNVT